MNDDTVMFSTAGEKSVSAEVRRESDGALAEDLYCTDCGYNLRGLYGDPARCPECGVNNDLGTVSVPAKLIRQALARMETAPTRCTAASILFLVLLCVLPFTAPGTATVVVLILIVLAVGWYGSYESMKTVFADRAGWRRILTDFHLAALLCTSPIGIVLCLVPVVFHLLGIPRKLLVDNLPLYWLGALAVTGPLILWGLRIYRRARERIAVMQRHAAVRIAREVLRRELHGPRW